jgi:hypothetical protein
MAFIPLQRMAGPSENPDQSLFAASGVATFVRVEVIHVNGGSILCE